MAVFFSQKSLTVTPNERQALALWEDHSEQQRAAGKKAWESLPVCSWPEFLRSLWDEYWLAGLYPSPPATLMNEWQERFLWLKVLNKCSEGGELINVPAASKLAREAWKLVNAHNLESELLSQAAYWPRDTQVFLSWVGEFKRECRQRHWLEPCRLEWVLAECLNAGHIPLRALPSKLLFSGFAEWTPAQRHLLDTLAGWGVSVTEECPQLEDNTHSWKLVRALDQTEELRLAARWLRYQLDQRPEEHLKVGLVIPNLSQRRAEVDRILTEVFQPSVLISQKNPENLVHDLSAGLPLAQWSIVADAMSLLALFRKKHNLKEWKVLLTSPYTGEGERERARRAVLWRKLQDDGRFEVERHRLVQLAQPDDEDERRFFHCPDLIRRLKEVERHLAEAEAYQLPSFWASDFSELLDCYGWPGQRKLDSVEYQTVSRWKALLGQFGSLDPLLGKIGRLEALATLRRLSEESVYQPKASSGQVEVMGTLEAVGLRFDYLWLAGFHDGAWPTAARPNPYLPYTLQKKHGVAHSTPERELDFARRVSHQLLAGASCGVVSYPAYSEDQHWSISPLFEQVPETPLEELELYRHQPLDRTVHQSGQLELFSDPGPPEVDTQAYSRGGSSLFRDQAACPFRAFALKRLNARPLEEVKEGLDARQRGDLLHYALEELWKAVRTLENWRKLSLKERERTLYTCAQLAVSSLRKKRPDVLRGAMFDLEVRRVSRLLEEWMELESTRQPFEVVATEEKVKIDFAYLNMQVTIDRIDRLSDGSLAVIDYKTGNARVKDWIGDRPKEPQLPLYCVAHPQPVDAICFAKMRTGQMSFQGLGKEDELIPGVQASEYGEDGTKSWEQRLAEWEGVLHNLAEQFRTGYAPVDPKDGSQTCMHCKLQPLCRVDESKELP